MTIGAHGRHGAPGAGTAGREHPCAVPALRNPGERDALRIDAVVAARLREHVVDQLFVLLPLRVARRFLWKYDDEPPVLRVCLQRRPEPGARRRESIRAAFARAMQEDESRPASRAVVTRRQPHREVLQASTAAHLADHEASARGRHGFRGAAKAGAHSSIGALAGMILTTSHRGSAKRHPVPVVARAMEGLQTVVVLERLRIVASQAASARSNSRCASRRR